MKWCVYILECADGSFYTGITSNIERRFEQHKNGLGAKYTRGRLPVKLLYFESSTDRPSATRRENEIKKLSKSKKLSLISQ